MKPLSDDAVEYLALADNIRSDGKYSFVSNPARVGEPTRIRQPLYPLFLAGTQTIFGTDIRFVQAVQALLVTGSVAVFYFLVRRIFRVEISLLASILLSL